MEKVLNQEEIDAIGLESRISNRRCKLLCHFEQAAPAWRLEYGEVRRVSKWNDEKMSRRDRSKVHDGDALVVAMDHACRSRPRDDVAEHT